ncbi:hypothetical protein N5F23_01620 [Pseudomonas sichuanensis]|uniref:hypothetical protein n=1 Tax=Pseudomonas sichuanensis TaxID=2213015 RepID=UPI0024487F30|nr:hypothetical protein [Pseudomonas sichuanensis]MDH0730124.1 hypothetical protein [Pseudomonas sichuanensis]MDH1581292.1 hypothetical protein [Pseudomonas sichuanensis]MDH1593700.1 hypothetical protein [Pseudomonas sichuanensis]MDH1597208.1 hypothetical protein [Pseudomonas sichuanensis]
MGQTFQPQKSFTAWPLYQYPGWPECYDEDANLTQDLSGSTLPQVRIVASNDSIIEVDGWLAMPGDLEVDDRYECPQFWFGCHEIDGHTWYEIRCGKLPWQGQWKYYGHRVDISRNGYLGLYAAEGVGKVDQSTPLWRLHGLDAQDIAAGKLLTDLKWVSRDGRAVKRLREGDFRYYFSMEKGGELKMALDVVALGAARPMMK